MKTFKLAAASSLAVLILLLCSAVSFAATTGATAAATINLTTLSIDFDGVAVIPGIEYMEAAAEMTNQAFYTDSVEAYYETLTGYGWGLVTPGVDLYAAAESLVPAAFEFGYGDSGYYGTYTNTGVTAGTLTISYQYFLDIDVASAAGAAAYAEAGVQKIINSNSTNDYIYYYAIGDDGYTLQTPWLNGALVIELAAGESVNFGIRAYAYADAVPAPASLMLLGPAILTLVGIRRKMA